MINPTQLTEHPKESEYIWKYMNIQKFMSFLMNKQFYYSRLDQLEDAFEGISQKYLSALQFRKADEKGGVIDVNHPYYETTMGFTLGEMEKSFNSKQKHLFVLCWVTGTRESAGMWNLYSESGSVALKISYQDFKNMLVARKYTFEFEDSISTIEFGSVTYKNYVDLTEVNADNFKVSRTAFRKDLSFEHEKEFRVCLGVKNPLDENVKGIRQKLLSLDILPVEVILHPKSSAYQTENIRLLVKTFAPNLRVHKSELNFR